MKTYIADDLRFIPGTHTTLRRLDVLTQLVRIIGTSHLPLEILKSKAEEWSVSLSLHSKEYAVLNGRLTNTEGKPTVAFKHYVSLLEELGLIMRMAQTVSLTKMGHLLAIFAKNKSPLSFQLSIEERQFYRYLLFTKDADLLLCSITLAQRKLNQKQVQESFEATFLDRLKAKLAFATGRAKLSIAEQKRTIQIEWRNAQKYAEHIAIPRLEWLNQLGLIHINRKGSNTNYTLSTKANEMVSTLQNIPGTVQCDIDNNWINTRSFSVFANLETNKAYLPFSSLPQKKQYHCLKEALIDAFEKFNSGNAMRMGVTPTLPYICIRLLSKNKIIIDIDTVIEQLQNTFIAENKAFSYRPAARVNEGYILVKIHTS